MRTFPSSSPIGPLHWPSHRPPPSTIVRHRHQSLPPVGLLHRSPPSACRRLSASSVGHRRRPSPSAVAFDHRRRPLPLAHATATCVAFPGTLRARPALAHRVITTPAIDRPAPQPSAPYSPRPEKPRPPFDTELSLPAAPSAQPCVATRRDVHTSARVEWGMCCITKHLDLEPLDPESS